MTKKFLRRMLVCLTLGLAIVLTIWGLFYNICKKNEELTQKFSIIADEWSKKVIQTIETSYKQEFQLIEGRIQEVSEHIFAQKPLSAIYSEENTVSHYYESIHLNIHGVVSENFWNECVEITPSNGEISIHYSYNDINLIMEMINVEHDSSTLYDAKEYLVGIIDDSKRLFEMGIQKSYIPPKARTDYWSQHLETLKKYEWQFLSLEFQRQLKEIFPDYEIKFDVDYPIMTEEENQIINSWKIS